MLFAIIFIVVVIVVNVIFYQSAGVSMEVELLRSLENSTVYISERTCFRAFALDLVTAGYIPLSIKSITSGLSPGKEATMIQRLNSTMLRMSGQEAGQRGYHDAMARLPTGIGSGERTPRVDGKDNQKYSHTRFSWPVPTFKQMKRTVPEAIARAPNANVTMTPADALSNPWTSRTTGTA
jgi:hypothetical protein